LHRMCYDAENHKIELSWMYLVCAMGTLFHKLYGRGRQRETEGDKGRQRETKGDRGRQRATVRLVFGPRFTQDTKLVGELKRLVTKGNNFKCRQVDKRQYTAYYDLQSTYVSQLCPDTKGSLVQRALVWQQEHTHEDGCLVEQIPHWIFPITGACTNSLTKTLIRLTSSPIWQDRCRSSKRWCTRSILETLRLWPPVRTQLRTCLKSVTIGGVDVPKGTQILLSNSVLHRRSRRLQHTDFTRRISPKVLPKTVVIIPIFDHSMRLVVGPKTVLGERWQPCS